MLWNSRLCKLACSGHLVVDTHSLTTSESVFAFAWLVCLAFFRFHLTQKLRQAGLLYTVRSVYYLNLVSLPVSLPCLHDVAPYCGVEAFKWGLCTH